MLGFMILGFGWLVEREWATPLFRKHFHFNEQSVLMEETGKLFVLDIDQPVGTGTNRPKTTQTQHSNPTDGSQHSMRCFQG